MWRRIFGRFLGPREPSPPPLAEFRIADESIDEHTQIVRVQWDVVYSTLTVTYSDESRKHDARNVLEMFASGWDAEIRTLSGNAQDDAWADKRGLVRDWIASALRSSEVAPVVDQLSSRGIRVVFSDDTEGASFEPF